ncbi:MAG: hypothetical protein RIS94_2902 [Pseudomonadota bacterium]|jgi:cell division protein ZapA
MSNVNLQIGGRTFTVSASDGEEAHIEMLGRMIDERVRKVGAAGQGEARMMLFAALVLADELHEEHRKGPVPAAAPAPSELPAALMDRVAALAERVEKLAAHLEEAVASA